MQSMPSLNNQHKHRTGLGSLVVGILLVTLFFLAWLNRQYIEDSIRFWQYQPSAAIESITNRTDLTDTGKFLFYSAQPVIDTGESYNKICNQHQENAAIVGCYTSSRIYLYDVTNPRLDGIKDVTAAHEMLHAAYQRLSQSDKVAINQFLEGEYDKLKNDPVYAERMAYYARTEPGQRYNELHSIIGTEIASIHAELEKHYQKYFSDRQKIVRLYEAYNTAFVQLEEKREQLSSQLDSLSAEIKTLSGEYASDTAVLLNDISLFNTKAESGGFNSPAEFSRARQVLVDRSAAMSLQRDKINTLIERFNALKNEYNSTIVESNDLYKSIDSKLSPAPRI